MVTRFELSERLETGKSLEEIEKFLDEMNINHDGAFREDSLNLVFIKTKNARETADAISHALDFGMLDILSGGCGVLTDKGPFRDHGSGWVYLRHDLI